MSVGNVLNIAKNVGAQALSSLYPNDFEWYMVALELVDSNDKTIDYLTFPIMPDSISKTEPTRTAVKKSLSGVTVLTSPTFTPQEITLKGSFGRQFKILTEPKTSSDPTVANKGVGSGKYSLTDISSGTKTISGLAFGNFNTTVKTGYGAIKILQAMISKSVGLDESGKPLRLYFYNLALGESYLVVVPPSGAQYYQDISKNMIWNYSITLMAIAPLSAVSNESNKTLKSRFVVSMVQAGVQEVASRVVKALKPVTSILGL